MKQLILILKRIPHTKGIDLVYIVFNKILKLNK